MSTATQPKQNARRVRKLLSLDGGGVRGLSSIIILGEILKKVNGKRNGSEKKEPWQEFDLIGGRSTGGLLAIMLGRLRMSTAECEKICRAFCSHFPASSRQRKPHCPWNRLSQSDR